MDTLIYWVGPVAVAVSALTGVLDAGRKQMDLVGAVLVGLAIVLGLWLAAMAFRITPPAFQTRK